MARRKTRRPPDRDPIRDYQEWAENRYNPGHWLGANMPPDVRNFWSPKDRRWLGLGFAIVGAVLIISSLRAPSSERWDAIYGLPWLVLGLVLLFSRDYPKARDK